MRLRMVLVLALVVLPALGFAKTKKPSTPAIFGTAKYVYVKAEAGDLNDPRLLREDRDAISSTMNALRAWGRYTVLPTADGAELVLIVRKGRGGSVQMGGTGGPVGTSSSSPFGGQRQTAGGDPGVMMGGEAGPPDDILEVRMKQPGGDLSGPVWQRSMSDGLHAPNVPLVEQLKRAVEKDYPQQ